MIDIVTLMPPGDAQPNRPDGQPDSAFADALSAITDAADESNLSQPPSVEAASAAEVETTELDAAAMELTALQAASHLADGAVNIAEMNSVPSVNTAANEMADVEMPVIADNSLADEPSPLNTPVNSSPGETEDTATIETTQPTPAASHAPVAETHVDALPQRVDTDIAGVEHDASEELLHPSSVPAAQPLTMALANAAQEPLDRAAFEAPVTNADPIDVAPLDRIVSTSAHADNGVPIENRAAAPDETGPTTVLTSPQDPNSALREQGPNLAPRASRETLDPATQNAPLQTLETLDPATPNTPLQTLETLDPAVLKAPLIDGTNTIRATEPSRSTGATQPASPPQFASPAQQVAEALRSVRRMSDGSHRLSLQLHPEDLGAIQLEVAARDGQLHVRAVAETESTRGLLNSSLSELRAGLADAGISAGSLEVGAETSGQRNAEQDRAEARPRPNRAPLSDPSDVIDHPVGGPVAPGRLDIRL